MCYHRRDIIMALGTRARARARMSFDISGMGIIIHDHHRIASRAHGVRLSTWRTSGYRDNHVICARLAGGAWLEQQRLRVCCVYVFDVTFEIVARPTREARGLGSHLVGACVCDVSPRNRRLDRSIDRSIIHSIN